MSLPNRSQQDWLRDYFETQVPGTVVYTATDGTDLLLKASRTRPHLVVFAEGLTKTSSVDVHRSLKAKFPKDRIVFLFFGNELPDAFQDDHSLGDLHYVDLKDTSELELKIATALNALSETSSDFKIRHLAPQEVLMKEGDDPEFLYFVLKGTLVATITRESKQVELGRIQKGEFVGEMSIVSNEKRVASVHADEPCQLLEIPAQDFNRVVLTRPSWAKVLISTLTRRLRSMNTFAKRP